ncbi:DUF4173 domain-containing protein [Elizabethkingia sp. HX WHF]|uniref:DUF4153 domain-containing protein n=1 Tax=Elizabethkingia TaxID=308865 RepID=UPI00099AC22F|nr:MULTISPECIES: DUF4173 domain-containing protein [Elizabethkingia]ATL43954.1 DUF4173 domain-containing protein [Elizabethkingia miricola]MCL1639611.1 DUF4173 domain-containing protein [Elizabethkingia bruuniana]MDX8565639.1 DUF4173 domain-containing protein [Elizabethkingia sp. HX WHF]OPC27150.1 beta-carotene 15,15'-monooxygenase [Elizabethkingia bruuniana]
MKTHHLILLTTFLFVTLFYNENMGLNLGILGIVYAVLTLINTPQRNKTRIFFILFSTTILSSAAFVWYGDFPSFLALISSLVLLSFRSKSRKLKTLFILPIVVTNCFTFLCRFFNFDKWLPERNSSGTWQKLLAIILIPAFFVFIFFAVYTYGSDQFANLFTNISWDINFWQLFCLSVLGFFLAFNYWNFVVERLIYKQHSILDNDFNDVEKILKPTYSDLGLDAERMSGVVTFLLLNILLVFFIVSYNYEQFYDTPKTPVQLSEETHERVGAVILSIIMVILVIMFYFKSAFNFDPKAKLVQLLAKVWIVLNTVLLFSAMMKNTEYIVNYGLTYKRFGVYAFLILATIGLVVTFVKIHKKKTNAFLFNTMFWFFYAMVLVISFVNWGGIVTRENIKRKDFSAEYHQDSVNFNDCYLLKYAEDSHNNLLRSHVLDKVNKEQKKTFLSRLLYYETINTK